MLMEPRDPSVPGLAAARADAIVYTRRWEWSGGFFGKGVDEVQLKRIITEEIEALMQMSWRREQLLEECIAALENKNAPAPVIDAGAL